MKKKFLSVFSFLLSLCILMLAFAACTTDNKGDKGDNITTTGDGTSNGADSGSAGEGDNTGTLPTHTHEYNRQKPYADCVAEPATCTSKAMYYYSCSCGETGTQTFEYGEFASCKFENGACKWCGKGEPAATEGLIFTAIKNGEAYMLTGYEGTASEIYIPSTHNGKPVMRITAYVFEENTNVTSVIIGDNIMYIDSHAFADCVNLKSVIIGSNVTELGEYAFGWCEKLESVELPDTLTLIGKGAFWMCSSLPTVKIPYGVTHIGEDAFGRCDSLTSVKIPDSVTSIDRKAFSWCLTLENIEVDEDNANYSSLQGNLYNKNQTTLIQYAMGKTDSDFAIPSSVTTIGYYAFAYCENIVNLEIPNSVTDIAYYAFGEVSGMKYNTKDGLNYLGNAENPYLYLIGAESKAITVAAVDDNCKFIGDFAFSFCTTLTNVTFGEASKLKSIGNNAFFYCGSLTGITIPDSVTSIHSPFYACTNLSNITFKNTENWYNISSRDDFENGTEGTVVNVTDSAANATNFMDSYSGYYWYKLMP